MSKLNYSFGQLNPKNRPDIGDAYDPETSSGVDKIKQNNSDGFTDKNSDPAIFNAVVTWGEELTSQPPGTWDWNVFGDTGEAKGVIAVTVKLPEQFAALPTPEEFPLVQVDGDWMQDPKTVKNSGIFTAPADKFDTAPSPGDIVSVSFSDPINRRGGKLLAIVRTGLGISGMGESGKKVFVDRKNTFVGGTGETAPPDHQAVQGVLNYYHKEGMITAPTEAAARAAWNKDQAWKDKKPMANKPTIVSIGGNGKWKLQKDAAKDWEKIADAWHTFSKGTRPLKPKRGSGAAFRTMWRQFELYKKYKTQAGPKAAYPGQGKHQQGLAVDIAGVVKDDSVKPQGDTALWNWLQNNASTYNFKKTVKSEAHHWVWQG